MSTTTTTHPKRPRLTGPLIATHSGHFHADEALAVFLLRLLPRYATSPLLRTRDPALLSTCHTVVDVGGEYDPDRNRFDHHQRGFEEVFGLGHATKLSSAGLVWKHLGREVVSETMGLGLAGGEGEETVEKEVDTVWKKVYADFVEAFDANDNGVSNYDVGRLAELGEKPRFNDRGFTIASVVGRFNYSGQLVKTGASGGDVTNGAATDGSVSNGKDEGGSAGEERAQEEEDARFAAASEFTGQQFLAELTDTVRSWLPARGIVRQCFFARRTPELDAEGRILVLPYRREGLPWHDHLFSAEEEEGTVGSTLYVLFPENGEPDSKWRIRAVSKAKEGFELRKPLPEAWRGVRDDELSKISGIEGGVFVHASGFIGGCKTYEGALAMAKKAVEID